MVAIENLQLETVPCDICSETASRPLFVACDEKYGVPGSFQVVRCEGCGLVYTNPRPQPTEMGKYYPRETYVPHHLDKREHRHWLGGVARRVAFGSPRRPALLGWLYNSIAFRAFQRPPAARPGRVLDVGCGVGAYLAIWRELGWEIEGVEPDAAAAAIARERLGVPIHQAFAEDLALPAGRFDLITFCHSLEHCYSPRRALAAVAPLLAPGGKVLIMVPNFASWLRLVHGKHWLGLEVPRHLYHFEESSMQGLLKAAGYRQLWIGCSAQSGVLLQHAQRLAGKTSLDARSFSVVIGALLAATQLPLAALQRADRLWAVAQVHAPSPSR